MLSDELKLCIQQGYSTYLKAKGHKPRYGQKLMIAAIARTLGNINSDDAGERQGTGHVCVVEAGTGTGKTVAYLLSAIPVARMLDKKVVISTATIALQEQIMFKDLPDVRKHSQLAFDYTLAKGRGRYLCLSKLDRLLAEEEDPFLPLYEEVIASDADTPLYTDMIQKLAGNQWDGDRDSWKEEIPQQQWARVTTDHRQCTGRSCSHVRNCAFFKARESLDEAHVIVANHDLVLADLALGGGAILPKPSETIYIFDEGHHLPDKALSHFAAHARIVATSRWLGQTEGQWASFIEPFAAAVSVVARAQGMEQILKGARQAIDLLPPLLKALIPLMDANQPVVRYRFEQGEVSADMSEIALEAYRRFTDLALALEKIADEVGRLLENEHSPVEKNSCEAAFGVLGAWWSRAEAAQKLFDSFAHSTADPKWPMARWVTLVDQGEAVDFELVSSPVLASHTLTERLWEPCYSAIATSATLTALGSFDRFSMRGGVPSDATFEIVPSPFDYPNHAVLRIPKEAVEAQNAALHTQNMIELLPKILDLKQGSLVLFSSRRQMLQVYEAVPQALQKVILMQGAASKQALLTDHRAAIDAGQGSVLFGLASFAEGVDLPGGYCEHVVIAKIPFAVPDDPIEAAMAEWIGQQGGNAFMQMSVPDAAVKLVQACGRLLRTESDTGVVTILDKRLLTKRYGQAILEALPPFKRELNV
ncbi:ATP-dependent DNA helicase DinG [Marinagarivorans algicola]|uniref:ATP-dependent DNA helicase DinG n=1 Tax=Marinagarivorans algicola TaxID=1513270 RepID=UPI0006B411F8|nr:ATP-dependent DNA helicase DinG [Marinagarivorans algicola]